MPGTDNTPVPLHLQRRAIAVRLAAAGVPDPAREADLLLCHFLGCSRTDLVLRLRDAVPAPAGLAAAVARRCRREPLAYILGETAFWGRRFRVTPAVLVPRPETEVLVEHLLATMPGTGGGVTVVDVGTGSGVIAATVAHQRPDARVVALDLSAPALAVAAANCRGLGVALLQGDCRSLPLAAGCCQRLAANLPYVASEVLEGLQPEVRAFEPRLALDGGPGGVRLITAGLAEFHRVLAPGGWLFLEIGYDQGGYCRERLTAAGWRDVAVHRDYAGHHRVVTARKSTT